MYELWSDWVFRVAQTDLLSHFNGDHFDMPYILCRLTGNPLRPMDSFARPMRASRFPWMGCLWSLPMKPYWKRLRARDKRSKQVDDDNLVDDLVDDDDSENDSENDDDDDHVFIDQDNLDPSEIEEQTRPPEEEITDTT
jgi:hypothetical protein